MSFWLWLFGGMAILAITIYTVNDGLAIAIPYAKYSLPVFLGTILLISYTFWRKYYEPDS